MRPSDDTRAEVASVTCPRASSDTATVRPEVNEQCNENFESVMSADEEVDEAGEENDELFAEASGSGARGNAILRDELAMDAKRLKKDFTKFRPWKHPDAEPVDGDDEADIKDMVERHEESGEVRRPRCLPHPGDPTADEVQEHRAGGHVNYRTWCPSCVKARGLMEQHRRGREAPKISIFSFDYLFIDEDGNLAKRDEEENAKTLVKVLVAHDTRTGCMFAHVVPQKGVDPDHFAVDLLVEDIKWLGFQRIML